MATKRLSPVQKPKQAYDPDLIFALNEYKTLQNQLISIIPIPMISEFKTFSESLSSFISISKLLAMKLRESTESSIKGNFKLKYEELQSRMIEENEKMQNLIQENEFLNKQIPMFTGKLENYRARMMENTEGTKEKEIIAEQDARIEELEKIVANNKEKLRMNSQLTQALSDSVKREEQLKKQCDQLLDSLHSALAEDEKLAMRIKQLEESSEPVQKSLKAKETKEKISRAKKDELLKLLETDIEKGGLKWKIRKYSAIEGLGDKENFEWLRRLMEYKDDKLNYDLVQCLHEKDNELETLKSSMMSKELALNELDSKKQSYIEETLIDRENDIKDLLKDYEKLQNINKELEKALEQKDFELINLREKLAVKSNQLVNIYENQDFNTQVPEELDLLRKQNLQLISTNQYLNSQLAVIRTKGDEYADLLQEFVENEIDKDMMAAKIGENFKWRLGIELQNLESSVINELTGQLEVLNEQLINNEMLNESFRVEIVALKALFEEDKRSCKDAKSNLNEWKKFRRDHVQRLEKIYLEQISELKGIISRFSKAAREKEEKLLFINQKYEKELKELTSTLKKEHDSKKMITDLFSKEKESFAKLKESVTSYKNDQEILMKKYSEAKLALEDSNKKIFQLEQEISKNAELEEEAMNREEMFNSQIEDFESIKSKLYNEITRLNKQIQEYEQEKQKLTVEKKSSLYFCEESREGFFKEIQDKEEKISELEKENFRLKNEIFELDIKLKSCENDAEKMQLLKKSISEMQKQVLSFDILSREKQYLEYENTSLREDLKNNQSTIQQLKLEIRNLSLEINELQNELAASENFARESAIKESQDQVIDLQTRISAILQELNSVKPELDILKTEIQTLQKQKKAAEQEIASISEEKFSLINLKKTAEAEISALKEEKAALQAFKKSAEPELLAMKEERQSFQSYKRNADSEISALKDLKRSAEPELSALKEEKAYLQNFKKSAESEISSLKEEKSSLQAFKKSAESELLSLNEEKQYLLSLKKSLDAEVSSLKNKITSKEISGEFLMVKEKVQELEMKYESLEASQDEMILSMRKMYKAWCNNKKVPGKRMSSITDPTREAVLMLDHVISEQQNANHIGRSEDISEYIRNYQGLAMKLDNMPDSAFKAYAMKLIAENVQLKQEMLERQIKGVEDNKAFKQLKDVQGVNDWVVQKWKESENDVSRLRDQLLQVTLELEKRIKIAKEAPADYSQQNDSVKAKMSEEIEYLSNENEYYKQRCMELEQELVRVNIEKAENKQVQLKAEKERDQVKKIMAESYQKMTNRHPDPDFIQSFPSLVQTFLNSNKSSPAINDYISEINLLREEIEFYKSRSNPDKQKYDEVIQSYKGKEMFLEKKIAELQSKPNSDSGLISALYEEKRLREELEEELTEKCNLLENILKEFEDNKKFLKLREYEYQELLTLKDEEILKMKCEMANLPKRV